MLLAVTAWKQQHIYADLETLWRDTLAKNPGCWMAHNNLGNGLLLAGKVPEAMGQFEQALRLKPDSANAHNNLGEALFQAGKLPEAIGHYELALRLEPNLVKAHNNLALALERTGKVSEAVWHYEQVVRLTPGDAGAHNNLGNALLKVGELREAIGHYEQGLRLEPDDAEAHNNLGIALERTGKVSEAAWHYEEALRIKPDYPEALNNLAWFLATRPLTESADPVRAVALAERACKLSDDRAANYLDTLAAAYAATGRFDDAVGTAQKAIQLARSGGQPELTGRIEVRLELYRSGHAYRRPVDEAEPHNP
jgi:superkiller protein 3